MDQPFECVVVDSPEIAVPAEPRPFHEHLAAAGERLVIQFENLGGGVAWLHVRIDQRPKYYAHAPYRLKRPGTARNPGEKP